MAPAPDTIVFLGPTLPAGEARAHLAAEYVPPARMGDVYRLLSARVRRIVLVDGVFHGVPSVWHRELLDAIVEGVEVIGASSMGALRAAELAAQGMRGIGEVYAWYRDGAIDGDDEVALVHGDADQAFRPLSAPLVNLRATLGALEARGAIDAGERAGIVGWLKAQHYPARSLRALAACPTIRAWPRERAAAVLAEAAERFVDVKRADAVAALRFAAAHPPSGTARPLPDEDRSERAMWRIGRSLRGTLPAADGRIDGQAIVAALDAGDRAAIERAVGRRAFLVAWARAHGLDAPSTRPPARRLGPWLDTRGLTAAAYDRLAAGRALAEWLCEKGPAAFGLAASANPADAFIADWGRRNGVAREGPDTDEGLAAWMLMEGPAHFGLPFHAEAAIADEIRLTRSEER